MHLSKTLMYANNGLCCMRTKKAQAIHTAYVVQDTFSAGWLSCNESTFFVALNTVLCQNVPL